MRNLTIKRTKSFVGCLGKMKIYIEDPASNEITINNTACRKIGDLKNGEEKTFQIDERAAKVFAIFDTLSKDYCNEFYQLPDGEADIFLSGKNKFNPANGNAFRFDNNESEEVAVSRKRGTLKGAIVLIVAVVIGFIIGFGGIIAVRGYLFTSGSVFSKSPEMKTFSSDGMTITLTDEFVETDLEYYTVAYGSKNVGVFALKQDFSSVEGFENYTPQQYADLLKQAISIDSTEVKTVDGLIGFEYDAANPQVNETYRYFTYVYKSGDAFWAVQFVTLSKNAEKYASEITEWAKSVNFSG